MKFTFSYTKKNKKSTSCAVIVICNNSTQFYWLKELALYKKRPRRKQIVYGIAKIQLLGVCCIFHSLSFRQ